MSGTTSNLIPKNDTPAHKSVAEFIKASGVERFTLDGQRGEQKSQLCKVSPDGRSECIEVALEAKDLFGQMQSLNFFCQLPQDPQKTHINCQKIPQ